MKTFLASQSLLSPSGIYYIEGDGIYPVYCDMTTNGGGWTLAQSKVFSYESGFWTNSSTYNPTDLSLTLQGDAKYKSFNDLPFDTLLFSINVEDNSCCGGANPQGNILMVSHNGTSLYSIMRRNVFVSFNEQKSKTTWLSWTGPKSALQQNCDRSGFNQYPIRIGFISSTGSQCSASSSGIGFGLQTGLGSNFATLYQSIGGPSLGNRCAQNPCSPGSNNAQIGGLGFLFVRDTINCTTCNGRGRCVGNQRCYCQNGYSGNTCQYNGVSCFSIPQNSSSVCSGRGKCVSIDNCECTYGFNGDECEFNALNETMCYGKFITDPTVCSGRGNCSLTGTCSCPYGYFGNECEVTTCFGKLSNDSTVCSGKGKCSATDVCTCNSGYESSNCSVPICFGTLSNSSTVCSGNGNCTSPNNCLCKDGYGSSNCSVPICFGTLASDPTVCSGNGQCNSPNTCVCKPGFITQNCSVSNSVTCKDGSCKSCRDIRNAYLANGLTPSSGIFTLYDSNSRPYNVYCDMTTLGGGWTLVMKLQSSNDNFSYTSPLWTNNNLLNEDDTALRAGSSKYRSYNEVPFNQVFLLMNLNDGLGTKGRQMILTHIQTSSMRLLMSSGQYVNFSVPTTRAQWLNFTGPKNDLQPYCNLQGFNAESQAIKVRIGIVGNNEADCGSGDSAIGFGISSPYPSISNSIGQTCAYACSIPIIGGDGYLFVRENYECPSVNYCYGDNTRSRCTANNACSCVTGFTGSDCSLPICFGILSNSSTVCSGKGNCSLPNSCSCNSGYGSADCSQTVCYGRISTNSTVCSGNGVCSSPNNCTCKPGYLEADCSIPTCAGLRSDDPSICSGKGICVAADTCQCNSGYTSSNCSIPLCFGVPANSSLVCSKNGICSSPNNCSCNIGYINANCSFPICFGKPSNDSQTCNGKGKCISPDVCQCNTGYGASDCNTPICYNIYANESTVCSGKGSCNSPNNCSCNQGYGLSNCSQPICYGRLATDSQVCSGNGQCISPDSCQCSGFTGNNCSLAICFGIPSNESSVCSGNGRCVKPDQCDCQNGFTGTNCSVPICFGILGNNSNVCSGNGECFGLNQCQCKTGYTGNNCSLSICYQKISNDSTVCSGNGQCISPNNCSCISGFGNLNCSLPICYNRLANDPKVCSGNGKCNSPNSCQCNTGYGASNCETPICYNAYANESTVCSGNGQCISPNNCSCNQGYGLSNCSAPICYGRLATDSQLCSGNGQCISPNNCQCSNGYTSDNCSFPICFGTPSNDSSVCSRNGACVGPNQCHCSTGYTANNCSLSICYQKISNDSTVCFGNGQCISPNNCSCNQGYGLLNCSQPICYGRLATDSQVCSGNGQCISPNNCQCSNGYTSNNCSFPMCFGTPSNDSSACSGNGNCVKPDQCICKNGYIGSNCSIPICYNVFANQSNVCSGNGQCISPNNCQCNSGYFSLNCSIPSCYNFLANDSAVCSSRGSCISPDNCQCNTGYGSPNCSQPICHGRLATNSQVCSGVGRCYTGLNCSTPICFGINGNNPSVCSGKGVCSSPNNCLCSNGYTGLTCQYSICNGKNGSNSDVCSGRGSCVLPNQCSCINGSSGYDCENYICFSKISNDTTVCSGKGKCIRPDTCNCTSGYTGNECQNFGATICYNRAFTDPQVCSGNGQCIDNNKCQCKQNYFGNNCENYNCFGISSTSSSVCSGKGKCISHDTCQCTDGYSGNCSVPICYGISGSESKVCGGNGKCTDPNQCSCASGFSGFSCNITTCFGKSSSDITVCSGRGTCVGPNQCQCKTGYYGNECQSFTCFNDASNPCSGHGTCIDADKCQCDYSSSTGFYGGQKCNQCAEGFSSLIWGCRDRVCSCNGRGICDQNLNCLCTGNFNGTFCETCKFGYVGSNCSIECNPNTKCNARGSCDQNGGCVCKDAFKGTSCEQCNNNYYGSSCDHYLETTFVLSDNGDKISGTVKLPRRTSNIDCSRMIHQDSLALLGNNPICGFNGDTFEIVFGQNPTFVQGSILRLNGALYSNAVFITVKVQFPSNPVAPTSILTTANVIGNCDDISLDASNSFDKTKRPLTYIWGLNNYGHDTLRNYLQTQTGSVIKVPNSFILFLKYNYTFSVQTKNFLGALSQQVQVDVMRFEKTIPIVKISGPAVQMTTPIRGIQLNGEITSCGIISNEYRWNQPGSQKVSVVTREKSIIIQSFPSFERNYTFEFIAKDISGDEYKASVIVMVVLPSLRASINGGSRTVSAGYNIEVSGTSSVDPANEERTAVYKWTCFNNNTNGLCPTTFKDQVSNTIQLPVGTWTISLLYQKGSRFSTNQIILYVIDKFIPIVEITSLPERINLDIPIVISINITSPNGISNFTSEITWKASSKNFLLTKEVTLSSLSSNTLIIKPFSLYYFDPVTFRVEARVIKTFQRDMIADSTVIDYGFAEVQTLANIPPQPSGFFVEPKVGSILSTEFTFICSQWSDIENDYPLQYSYRYIDPKSKSEVILSQFSLSSTFKTQLPPGDENDGYKLTIVACVIDSLGALSKTSTTVVVAKPKFDNEADKLSFVSNSLATINSQNLVTGSLSIFSILNEPQKCATCNDTSELNSRRNTRQQLFTRLKDLYDKNTKDISPDEEAVSQQTFLMTQLTKTPNELSTQNVNNITLFLDSMINSNFRTTYSTGRFPEDIAQSSTLTLSQLFTTTSSEKNLTSNAEKTLTNLLKNIINQKEVGEAPTVIKQDSFIISGQRQNNNTIQGLNITLGNDGTKFNLPNDLKFNTPVDIQAVNYAKNPYLFNNDTSKTNGSQTSFVSLSFYYSDGRKMNISNLTTPISFEMVGNFTEYKLLNATPNPCDPYDWECTPPPQPLQYQHVCKYWDTKLEIWSTKGCKVNSTSKNSVICQCDHLTTFSTFVDLLPEFNYPKLDPNNPVPLLLTLSICLIYLVLWLIVSAYEIYIWKYRKNIGKEVDEEIDLKSLGFVVLLYELFKQNHSWFSLILRPKYAAFNLIRSRKLTIIFNDIILAIGVSTLMYGRDNKEVPTLILAAVISAAIKLPFSKIIAFLFEKIKVWEPAEKKVLTVLPVREESHQEMFEEDLYFSEAKQDDVTIYYCVDCMSEELTTQCSKCSKVLGVIEEIGICSQCEIPVKTGENCLKCLQPIKIEDNESSSNNLSPMIIVEGQSNQSNKQKKRDSDKKNRTDIEELRKKIKERKLRKKRRNQNKVMAGLSKAQDKIDTTYEKFILFSKTSKCGKPLSIMMIITFIFGYFVGVGVFLSIMNFTSLQKQWHPVMNSIIIGASIFLPFIIVMIVYWLSKRHHYQLTGEWTYPIAGIIYLILQILFFSFVIVMVSIFGGIYELFVNGFEVIFTVVYSLLFIICSIVWLILYCIKPKKENTTLKLDNQGWPAFLILIVYAIVIVIAIGMIIITQFFGTSYTSEKTVRWVINSLLGLVIDIFVFQPMLVLVRALVSYMILPFINNSLST